MWVWLPAALLAVLTPEGLGKHSTGLEKSTSAWARGTQLLWHSQVGHGLEIARKTHGGRQAPTPERGITPAKPRPRGTRMLQLVLLFLQMRKKRWWQGEGAGGCLSCRPDWFAHLRPGSFWPCSFKRSSFQKAKNPPEKPQYHLKIYFFGAVTTFWSNSCSLGLPSPPYQDSQPLHPTEVLFPCFHGTRLPPPRGTMLCWGTTMGRAVCLGLQNWTVVSGLPIPTMRLLPKTSCPVKSHPNKTMANTSCFGGSIAETRQTWAHPAARQDSRRTSRRTVELWVSYMTPLSSEQLKPRQAHCSDPRII